MGELVFNTIQARYRPVSFIFTSFNGAYFSLRFQIGRRSRFMSFHEETCGRNSIKLFLPTDKHDNASRKINDDCVSLRDFGFKIYADAIFLNIFAGFCESIAKLHAA